MIKTIRNYSKIIIIIVCVAMVATGALMGYGFMGGGSSGNATQSANVAVVNGRNISQDQYYSVLRNQTAEMQNIPRAQEIPFQVSVLNSLIDRELILQQADNLNIESEVREQEVDELIAEILEEYDMSEEELVNNLEINQMSLEQFRRELKKDLELNKKIEQTLEYAYSDLSVSEEEIARAYERVHPQVLVQRFNDDKANTEEEINELRNELSDGADFVELAEEHSDMARVDLGQIARDNNLLPAAITEELFAVEESGLTDIIEGEDAFYIFNIVDIRSASGEDYEAKKEELRNDIEHEKQNEAIMAWLDELRAESNIRINNPILSGYNALDSGNIDKAISSLEQAVESYSGSMPYVYLAEAYKNNGQLDKAEETFERAIEDYSQDWELHLEYATFLIDLENEEKAISLLDQASELAGDNMMAQYQLYMAYAHLGAEEKAEAVIDRMEAMQNELESEEDTIPGFDTGVNEDIEIEDLESDDLEIETINPEN